jgi:succinate-acetate transporter protein
MIYIPGTGIMAAYTDAKTGNVDPEFYQALSMYCWAWFIMNTLYTVAAIRTTWVLFLDLAVLDLAFLLLGTGYMVNSTEVLKAANAVLLVTAFLSCKVLLSRFCH